MFVLSTGSVVTPSALGIFIAIVTDNGCEGADCLTGAQRSSVLGMFAWLMWVAVVIGAVLVEVFRRDFEVTVGVTYGVGVGLVAWILSALVTLDWMSQGAQVDALIEPY